MAGRGLTIGPQQHLVVKRVCAAPGAASRAAHYCDLQVHRAGLAASAAAVDPVETPGSQRRPGARAVCEAPDDVCGYCSSAYVK